MLRVGHREENIARPSAAETNRGIFLEYIAIEGRREVKKRRHINEYVDCVYLFGVTRRIMKPVRFAAAAILVNLHGVVGMRRKIRMGIQEGNLILKLMWRAPVVVTFQNRDIVPIELPETLIEAFLQFF